MDKYTLYIKVNDKSVVSLFLNNEEGDAMRFKVPLEKYLEIFNAKNYIVDTTYNNINCSAYLCFYGPVELVTQTSDVYNFSQNILRENNEKDESGNEIKPILHLAMSNLLFNSRKRYSKIVDSSIWNYFVQISRIEDLNKIDYNFTGLLKSVKNIIKNYNSKLYDLSVACEYADFHSRLLEASYLSESNGHGKNVSPFLFHSENLTRAKIDKYYIKNDVASKFLSSHKWRILLLDDHALAPMSKKSYREENEIDASNIERSKYIDIVPDKLRIIVNNILSVFQDCKIGYVNFEGDDRRIYDEKTNMPINKTYDIVFYCVSSVDKVTKALENHRYEIILLDYLLGNKKDGAREYSYELLSKLSERYKKNQKDVVFGPHGRLYFSFISAFTTAVNERLLSEGQHKSQEFWHIADGACPTNTPELFLYNLLHLMKKRLDDMGLGKLSVPNYKENKTDFDECHIKSRIIDEIYGRKDSQSGNGSVRQSANEKFDKVLSLLYHYKNLLRDTHNPGNVFESEGSVLATDFIEKNPDLGGFLEHLMQLVYLTAYGTVRQWPEMWEEYQFIKTVVGVQENIENYILSLKNNNIGS